MGKDVKHSKEEYARLAEIALIFRKNGKTAVKFMEEMEKAGFSKISKDEYNLNIYPLIKDRVDDPEFDSLNMFETFFLEEFVGDSKFSPSDAYYKTLEKYPEFKDEYDESDHTISFKILEKKKVQKKLDLIKKKAIKAAEINVEYVLLMIKDVAERCSQAQPVKDQKGNPILVKNGNGVAVPAYTFDASNVLKASELLGKYLTMFSDKKVLVGDKNNPIEANINHSGLPSDPIEAAAAYMDFMKE